jgi:hypothetical protein
MKVEKSKFDKVLGNLLRQQPLKRADAKIGEKKKAEKLPEPTRKPESDQQ